MRKLLFFLGVFMSLFIVSCTKDKTTTNENNSVDTNEVTDTLSQPVDQVEEYKIIDVADVEKLNASIIANSISSKEGIMQEYMPEDIHAEGRYSYIIKVMNTEDSDHSLVLLTIDGVNDDSVKSIKVVMTVKALNDILVVKQIKTSYRCWEGRGHQNWSAYPCS